MSDAAVSMVLVGDVMVNRDDASSMLRHVAGPMKEADIVYCNLEGPVCDRGDKHPGKAGIGMELRSRPNAIHALQSAGINVVSLANNHTLDYGTAGLEQTVELLRGAGIAYAGAAGNRAQAHNPAVVEKRGLRVAVLSFASGCHPSFAAGETSPGIAVVRIETTYAPNLRLLMQPGSPMLPRTNGVAEDVNALIADVKAAKAEADVVIVAWHWGVSERWGKLADYQRTLGHAAIDAGASAIAGTHAHMVHGIEFYRGCPIFYSLGNFAFDMDHRYFRPESMIVRCSVTREGVRDVTFLPILVNQAREPTLARGRDADRVAWLVEYLSEEWGTRFVGDGAHIRVMPPACEV